MGRRAPKQCPTGYRRFMSREAALNARAALVLKNSSLMTLKAMWCPQCRGCHLTHEPKRLLEVRP